MHKMSRGSKPLMKKLLDNCCSLTIRRGSLLKSLISSSATACSSEPPSELEPLDPRRKLRTAVLLLGHGEPRDAASAREYLQKRASSFYRCPQFLSRPLTSLYWNIRGDKYIADLMAQSAGLQSPADQLKMRSVLLQITLNELMPEFAPFGCYYGSLFDEPNIETTVEEIHRDAPERLIVLPNSAHYSCYSTGSPLNQLTSVLLSRSHATIRSGEVDESCRSLVANSEAFELTPPVRWTLIDRWASHPVLSDTWSKLIERHIASFPEDVQERIGIVFCAPVKRFYGAIDYKHEISASCVRTMEALGSRFAWRLGWFSSWDQWPYLGRRSVLSAIRQLKRQNRPNILLVPLPYTCRNLDTQVVLPRIVSEVNLKRAKAHQVELVQPEDQHPTLIQGLAEVIKNHLLHGRYVSGQFSQHCSWCYRSQCGHTKRFFGRPTVLRSQALSDISDRHLTSEPL